MMSSDEMWDLAIDLGKVRQGLQAISDDFQNIYRPEEARVRWHQKWQQVSWALELADSLLRETIDQVDGEYDPAA